MKPAISTRHLVLGGALFCTLAATAWVSRFPDKPDSVAVQVGRPVMRTAMPVPVMRRPVAALAHVKLSPLQRTQMTDNGQDIFAVSNGFAPPPAPVVAEAPPPPPPPPAPTAPPWPYVYMGKLLEDGSTRAIVYLVQGNHAQSVSVGDVIDNTYRVDKIDSSQMVVTYLPLATQQIIQIGNGPS